MRPVLCMGLIVLGIMKLRSFSNLAKVLPLVLTVAAFSVQAAAQQYRSTNPALVARAEQSTRGQVSGDRDHTARRYRVRASHAPR